MAGRVHRKLKHRLTLTCQAFALFFAAPAYAARPFFTDDARIVEHCQIESFYKEQRRSAGSEFWFLPACKAFGQHRETPTYHYGIRFWVIPNRFQIDTTRGDQTGTANRTFYTVGVRLLF